jgi:hypothetical protein
MKTKSKIPNEREKKPDEPTEANKTAAEEIPSLHFDSLDPEDVEQEFRHAEKGGKSERHVVRIYRVSAGCESFPLSQTKRALVSIWCP